MHPRPIWGWIALALVGARAGATGASPTPPIDPHGVCEVPEPTDAPNTEALRSALAVGDAHTARHVAEQLVAGSKGRERDAARFVLGTLLAEEHDWRAAAEAFGPVRSGGGPLARHAAVAEADAHLRSGHPKGALKACAGLDPDSDEGLDCLAIRARASAKLGDATAALDAADAWDRAHRDHAMTEHVRLDLALRQSPGPAAARTLRDLALHHTAPVTGRTAEAALARMAAAGVAEAIWPDDLATWAARAISLRDDRRRDEAWNAFEVVRTRKDEEPWAARWVDESVERFASATHRWDDLLTLWQANWNAEESGEAAWGLFRVNVKAGNIAEAARWAAVGRDRFSGRGPWRRQEEAQGRALFVAGDPKAARERFEAAARQGGMDGRRASLLAGVATLASGDAWGALERFQQLAARDPIQRAAALYWTSRAHTVLESATAANEACAAVHTVDPTGWYATLCRGAGGRDGRWPQPDEGAIVDADWTLGDPLRDLPWGPGPGPWFDDATARETLRATALTTGSDWPDMLAAADLAGVGLYERSGLLLGRVWEGESHSTRGSRRPDLDPRQWRFLFWAARDAYHAAKTTPAIVNLSQPDEARDQARRLGWPLAFGRQVWNASSTASVDPYLVLALMRQESTYRATARSRVGARGPMQVMPRTGALLADRIGDLHFTAADLDDPVVAVRYGVDYLGRLLDRFEGHWPVAVAAYNAGPTQVSAWAAGGDKMDVATWVEMIPVRETRDYVRKVGAGYATYLELYLPGDSRPAFPRLPSQDHPDIVDF